MTRFPLLVQFEYHIGSKAAAATADYLHEVLNDDPAVPGLRVPTCFVRDAGTIDPPEPQIASERPTEFWLSSSLTTIWRPTHVSRRRAEGLGPITSFISESSANRHRRTRLCQFNSQS